MWPGLLLPWIDSFVFEAVALAGGGVTAALVPMTTLARWVLLFNAGTDTAANAPIILETATAHKKLAAVVPQFAGGPVILGVQLESNIDNSLRLRNAGAAAVVVSGTIVFADAPRSLFPHNAIRGVNA